MDLVPRLDGRETAATELRQALAAFTNQGKHYVLFYQGLPAEIEAHGDAKGTLPRIKQALALAGETGERGSDAFLHRLRGEILLKLDPANTARAEECVPHCNRRRAAAEGAQFCVARGALAGSTDRPADAHTVLASALNGFSPIPEFPEIAEAPTLLAALTS